MLDRGNVAHHLQALNSAGLGLSAGALLAAPRDVTAEVFVLAT
jgi:hypothetical protein